MVQIYIECIESETNNANLRKKNYYFQKEPFFKAVFKKQSWLQQSLTTFIFCRSLQKNARATVLSDINLHFSLKLG